MHGIWRAGLALLAVVVAVAAGAVRGAAQTPPASAAATRATATAATVAAAAASSPATSITVDEGTSMAVSVSPDGRTLAIDLQGSIYTLPATGGTATRLTDPFNDARQPAWSPDGRTIAFFAFRDGGYDLWAIDADGRNQRKLTWGPGDDREPSWSHDGTRIAFSSDRPAPGAPPGSGSYDIWVLDIATGDTRRLTTHAAEDTMPAWSPDDAEIAFASTREEGKGIWAVRVADGVERKVASAAGRVDAVSWAPAATAEAAAAAPAAVAASAGVSAAASAGPNTVPIASGAAAPGARPASSVARAHLVAHELALSAPAASYATIDGARVAGDENVFPFRVSWASPAMFYYTADGRIRTRTIGADGRVSDAKTIPFTATLPIAPARFTPRRRDVDSRTPRKALGLVHPVISPDGSAVAFAALGDIYIASTTGTGTPRNITRDEALDTDPAWSHDGARLVYSSDKGGGLLQLWLYDVKSGAARPLTTLSTQPMAAAWSPDDARIAFLEVDGAWRRAAVSVIDVATGKVTRIHASLFGPGAPTWSPDGARVAVAMVWPFSTRFREGTNQVLTIAADGRGVSAGAGAAGAAEDRWFAPVPSLSIDSRGGAGPVWSPDGTKMAAIYEGVLTVWPVARDGAPIGPPRRLTTEIAHAPSWTGDSRRLLYQSNDRLKTIDLETGESREIPIALSYTPSIPTGRILLHAGRLVDGESRAARADVDILIEGNRIRAIEPHSAARHEATRHDAAARRAAGAASTATTTLIDAPDLTAMPGLIEFHSHLQKDFGANAGRAFLAYGITTVRSPGSTPYEAVEDREANEAGVRPGPRVFGTGYLMEWQRVYYKMGVAISGPAQFELELARAKVLRHDLLKSYVRLPDLQQRRMVEFTHANGLPVATHEVYPAALAGVDHTEHTAATSRRGYSPKSATLSRAYADVVQLFAKGELILTPTFFGASRRLLEAQPALKSDPRLSLYPAWLRESTIAPPAAAAAAPLASSDGTSRAILAIHRAGGRIVAGTDTPNGLNLHAELLAYVQAGLTPYEALRTATVTPAAALALDAGVLAPGKLADIVLVSGNPLENITATLNVRRVIANGRAFEADALISAAPPRAAGAPPTR